MLIKFRRYCTTDSMVEGIWKYKFLSLGVTNTHQNYRQSEDT